MAQSSRILVDTDILIKIYRGNSDKQKILLPVQNKLAISVITAIELMSGAKNKKKQYEVAKTIKAYFLIDLSFNIGTRAYNLIKKYTLQNSLGVADALIAASAIEYNFPLYADNISDYKFIKELQLYRS